MTGEEKIRRTRTALDEALQRMRSGATRRLGPKYDWSKANLAREAGLNVNTLLRKKRGSFVYAEANLALEHGPDGLSDGEASKRRMRLRVAELEAKVTRLQRRIFELEKPALA